MKAFLHSALPILTFTSLTGSALAQLQIIRQGRDSHDVRDAGDKHGQTVASGDFNGDGFGDLAAGAPGEKASNGGAGPERGVVIISYGTPRGITWAGARRLSPSDSPQISGENDGYSFGGALAAGDFNQDGYDDLAVGGRVKGMVFVYYGSASGPGSASRLFRSEDFGSATDGSHLFGGALAAGRLAGDSYDDLVIGAPGNGGRVYVLKGSAAGLTASGGTVIRPSDLAVPITGAAFFGGSLAIGNMAGQAEPDLLIGAPFATVDGKPLAGLVTLVPGSNTPGGLTPAASVTWNEADAGGTVAASDGFGSSLAAGDFWHDGGELDIAIGAPGWDSSTGRVYLGRSTFFGPAWPYTLRQLPVEQEPGDQFGTALAAVDHDGDGFVDLAVGSPGEDLDPGEGPLNNNTPLTDAGRVQVFHGSAAGLNPGMGAADLWHFLLSRNPAANVRLGYSLAAARITAGPRRSVLAGAPGEDGNRGEIVDWAPWRQPDAPQCTSALSVDCDARITYALRPFDEVKIASTTKIMTVLLGCEATQKPVNHPGYRAFLTPYPISQNAWIPTAFPATTTCSAWKFNFNDTPTFEDLLRTCIMVSGNDSAMAIADVVTGEIVNYTGTATSAPLFVQMMNDRAALIGMTQTHFTNPPGIDTDNPYSTAYDMYLLARHAMQNPLFRNLVSTVSHPMIRQVPDGLLPNSTKPVQTSAVYNWLLGLRKSVPSAAGIKPGSTGGAGFTAVMAAPDPYEPSKYCYAGGFGWQTTTDWRGGSRSGRLLQFAVDGCPPPPKQMPDSFALPPFHTHGLQPVPALPTQVAFSLPDAESAKLADGTPGAEWTLDFQSADPAALTDVEASVDYRLLITLAPAGSTEGSLPTDQFSLNFAGIEGWDGVEIANPGMVPADLELTGITPVPVALLLPAVQKVREAAARSFAMQLGLRNLSRSAPAEIVIELHGVRFHPQFGRTPPWRSGHTFSRTLSPVWETMNVTLSKAAGGPAGPLTLVLQPRGESALYPYPPVLDGFSLQPGAAGPQVNLAWSAPADYYRTFRVLHSPDLSAGSWTPLAVIPAGTSPERTWSGAQPAGGRGYFRVEGSFSE